MGDRREIILFLWSTIRERMLAKGLLSLLQGKREIKKQKYTEHVLTLQRKKNQVLKYFIP